MVVVFAATEMEPFCTTGELADVIGALPVAIAEKGHEVVVMLPGYSLIDRERYGFTKPGVWLQIPVGREQQTLAISSLEWKGITVYLLENDEYFDRPTLYGNGYTDYTDNGLRFMFYSRGLIETLRALDIRPDVVHCHDWPSALVVSYLASLYKDDPFFINTATLFTIHRLKHQGLFHESVFWLSGLPSELFRSHTMEHFGNVSFIKGGIVCADAVSTVSETYAREITTRELGFGLDELFAKKKENLYGIVNGIDMKAADPAADPLIPAHFSADDPSGKSICREHLLKTCGLKADDNVPIFGMVSRLDDQKGIHLLEEAVDSLANLDIRLIILGTDTREHQELTIQFASRHPQRIRVLLRFDKGMSRLIYAGSDIFLMPSRWEPGGLGQLVAMRYGTIPLVHKTGGLADTVRDLGEHPKDGTGFSFKEYTVFSFVEAASRAVGIFRSPHPGPWDDLIGRVMRLDHSWGISADKYIALYERIHERRHG